MFTVALIGADGAGKTTICRHLKHALPVPSRYVYMGVNLEAANIKLPTTWLVHKAKRICDRRTRRTGNGPPDLTRIKPLPKKPLARLAAEMKSGVWLLNRLGEEWFRQALIWFFLRRGNIVLFDRHYYSDYYAHDIANRGAGRPLGRRIHGFLLDRFYPKPELVILLDAPAELLFARKSEGTLESLERRVQEYRQLRGVLPDVQTVDASQPENAVLRDVANTIRDFYQTKHAQEVMDR